MEGYYTHIGSGLYRLPSQTPRSQNWRHLHTLTPGWVFTGDEFDSRIQQPWWWQCSLKTRLSWYAFVCLFMPSSSLEANWSFCLVLFWNSLLLYRPGQPQNPGNPPALDATPGLMANCARAQEVQSKQHQIPNVSVNIPDTEKNKKKYPLRSNFYVWGASLLTQHVPCKCEDLSWIPRKNLGMSWWGAWNQSDGEAETEEPL